MPSPCSGKLRFATEIDALKARRPGLMTTSYCGSCDAWHLLPDPAARPTGARKLRKATHYARR